MVRESNRGWLKFLGPDTHVGDPGTVPGFGLTQLWPLYLFGERTSGWKISLFLPPVPPQLCLSNKTFKNLKTENTINKKWDACERLVGNWFVVVFTLLVREEFVGKWGGWNKTSHPQVLTGSGKWNTFSLFFFFTNSTSPAGSITLRAHMPSEETWLKRMYTSFLSFPWLFPKRTPVRMHGGNFSNLLSNCLWARLFFSRSN